MKHKPQDGKIIIPLDCGHQVALTRADFNRLLERVRVGQISQAPGALSVAVGHACGDRGYGTLAFLEALAAEDQMVGWR